ncbi:MAG: hypothetical protein WDN50_07560 [Bradyrhizobium sp.]
MTCPAGQVPSSTLIRCPSRKPHNILFARNLLCCGGCGKREQGDAADQHGRIARH